MTPQTDAERRFVLFLIGLLSLITLWGIGDLILDQPRFFLGLHTLFEIGFVLSCLSAVLWLWLGWFRSERSLDQTRQALTENQAEHDAWRERAQHFLQGLGREIDHQFEQWQLTKTERETAMLLLKGFSHREIASLAGKSEKTVRQHSVTIYRKSKLGGRAELSAFFLEDLLLPATSEAPTDPASSDE